jgi:hypothetical protein
MLGLASSWVRHDSGEKMLSRVGEVDWVRAGWTAEKKD